MNSMISTAPFLSLQKSVILYSLKFTKTVSSWGRETIKFFIMIAQTTTSRLNRKTVIKSMERAKNTDRILSTDGDGIPLAFSLFPGSQNEQKSLKPLETKILQQFGCQKFIYCSDAGLASEDNRVLNHLGQRSFIVTQSIKKLPAEDREWALNTKGFKRLSDDSPVDITQLSEDDKQGLFYKDEPYTTKKLHQRLIITYSPKYAAYEKAVRAEQIARAEKMVANGAVKRQRKNPNDPARFVNKIAATKEGEKAEIHYYLDLEKIAEEEKYDGLYAVCTDLLDDDVADILKVSEGRWQIEDCFRTMKTDFDARPVYVSREDRIQAHFLICFLALLHFRMLKKALKTPCTTEQLLHILRSIKFADIEEQGFMPVYERQRITDELHEACGFRTDYQFITNPTVCHGLLSYHNFSGVASFFLIYFRCFLICFYLQAAMLLPS